MDQEYRCKHCNSTNLINDEMGGCVVCANCGIRHKGRVISDSSEWRSFEKKSGDNSVDPNRVGGPTNPLLGDSDLSTTIGGSRQGDWSSIAMHQDRNAVSAKQRALISAFGNISSIASRLELSKSVIDCACEVYKQIDDSREMKGRKNQSIIGATIYIACKLEDVPRTLKELCKEMEVTKSEVSKVYMRIQKLSKTSKISLRKKKRPHPDDDSTQSRSKSAKFIVRFGKTLKCPNPVINAAEHVCHKVDEMALCSGKTPSAIAAAALFLCIEVHPKFHRSIDEIAFSCQVGEVALRHSFEKMNRHINDILPKDFCPSASRLRHNGY